MTCLKLPSLILQIFDNISSGGAVVTSVKSSSKSPQTPENLLFAKGFKRIYHAMPGPVVGGMDAVGKGLVTTLGIIEQSLENAMELVAPDGIRELYIPFIGGDIFANFRRAGKRGKCSIINTLNAEGETGAGFATAMVRLQIRLSGKKRLNSPYKSWVRIEARDQDELFPAVGDKICACTDANFFECFKTVSYK